MFWRWRVSSKLIQALIRNQRSPLPTMSAPVLEIPTRAHAGGCRHCRKCQGGLLALKLITDRRLGWGAKIELGQCTVSVTGKVACAFTAPWAGSMRTTHLVNLDAFREDRPMHEGHGSL